eukprot:1148108-Pelagomonas_calceolata.AAC.3
MQDGAFYSLTVCLVGVAEAIRFIAGTSQSKAVLCPKVGVAKALQFLAGTLQSKTALHPKCATGACTFQQKCRRRMQDKELHSQIQGYPASACTSLHKRMSKFSSAQP